jgi:hypothetical protein
MKFSTENLEKDFTEKEMMPEPKKRRGRKKKVFTPENNQTVPQPELPQESEKQEQIPPRQEAQPQVVVVLSPESCTAIYTIMGKLLAAGVSKFKDVPAEIASRAMEFTEEEKKVLGPQTAKVLNKYAPQWLMKYADELMLITLISGSVMGKLRAVDEWKAENTVDVRTKNVTAMPQPTEKAKEAAVVQ